MINKRTADVLSVVELLADMEAEANTVRAMAEKTCVSPRTVRRQLHACRRLGLVDWEGAGIADLTPLGREVQSVLDRFQQQLEDVFTHEQVDKNVRAFDGSQERE